MPNNLITYKHPQTDITMTAHHDYLHEGDDELPRCECTGVMCARCKSILCIQKIPSVYCGPCESVIVESGYFNINHWNYIPSIHALHTLYPDKSCEEINHMKDSIRQRVIAHYGPVWPTKPYQAEETPRMTTSSQVETYWYSKGYQDGLVDSDDLPFKPDYGNKHIPQPELDWWRGFVDGWASLHQSIMED